MLRPVGCGLGCAREAIPAGGLGGIMDLEFGGHRMSGRRPVATVSSMVKLCRVLGGNERRSLHMERS